MKFFKKTSVAVTLTVLIVALCCVWGYSRVYVDVNPYGEEETTSAGESNLNYYLSRIDDDADLFSASAIDQLARDNLTLDNAYNSLVAVKTVKHLNGRSIEDYAADYAKKLPLGYQDLLLFLDADTQNWYVAYGPGMASYVAATAGLPNLFREHIDDEFWGILPETDQEDEEDVTPYEEMSEDEQYIYDLAATAVRDASILELFDDLAKWYKETLPQVESAEGSPFFQGDTIKAITISAILSGILLNLMANLWWIVLVLAALYIVDGVRFEKYYDKYPPGTPNPPLFRPFLFWHRAGSKWYRRRLEAAMEEDEEDEFDDDEDDDRWDRGPGYSTDPNEPGPFNPKYSTDPNEPGPFGPNSDPRNHDIGDAEVNQPPTDLWGQIQSLIRTLTNVFRKK